MNTDYVKIIKRGYKKLPESTPTLGGFIVLMIKVKFGFQYRDFDHFGFGANTVRNWCIGDCSAKYDDIEMICDFYNLPLSHLNEEAKKLRAAYKVLKNDEKTVKA